MELAAWANIGAFGDRRLSNTMINSAGPVMPDAKLEVWLNSSARRRSLVLTLSALEGFLTAGVVGPRLPNPFSPMFAALGLSARAWHNPTPAESAVLGAVTAHHNRIAELLSERPKDFAPRFIAKPGGGNDPRPWCQGFYDAVDINRDEWGDILNPDNRLFGLFLPIFIYSKSDKGLPVLGPPRPGTETAAFIEDEAHTD
ncbi:UPF0149 family protein, partial [Novosphingobium sp. 9U]|uniref:UPF0149 family protein n=1 Tax=Novosphingobium sp. 9U TaxID=2653158 RepID=UPI001F15CF52